MEGKRDHILKRFAVQPELVVSLLLVVCILFLYYPLLSFDFINLDDTLYVTENPHVQEGLSLKGIIWAFGSTSASHWQPLTWISHMLDCQVYGLDPGMHHATSLILHAVNSLLLFWILNRITGSIWPSALVAALFGLHPINVDSVAWIAQRKNLLSTFFAMLVLLVYSNYVKKKRLGTYLLALFLFSLSLMAKPIIVTLPFVLLLLDFWPIRRMHTLSAGCIGSDLNASGHRPPDRGLFSLVFEKIPFFFLCAASIITSSRIVHQDGIVVSPEMRPMSLRIANALVSYLSYLGKMVWPDNLTIFYPYPKSVPFWKAGFASLIIGGISIYAVRHLKTKPYLGVGWFWFLGTLFPFIGLTQAGLWPAMADRWAYISFIGLFICVAWGGTEVVKRWRVRPTILCITLFMLFLLLLTDTRYQVQFRRNSITLFEHAIDVTSDNYAAHSNLGYALDRQGRTDAAERHFIEALRIRPDTFMARYNLANLLKSQGRFAEAIAHYNEVLRTHPDYAPAHNNLGTALIRVSEIEKIIAFSAIESKNRDDASTIHHMLAKAGTSRKEIDAAVFHFTRALQIDPESERVATNLEMARKFQRKVDDALERLESVGNTRKGYIDK